MKATGKSISLPTFLCNCEREEEKEVFPVKMATLLIISEVHFGSSSRKQFQKNEEKDDKQVRKDRQRERDTVSCSGWPGYAL